MDMFKPFDDQDLSMWRKEYNVSDSECQDPSTWGTDKKGIAMKHTKVHTNQKADICFDARSERVARRSARNKKLKDAEYAEL